MHLYLGFTLGQSAASGTHGLATAVLISKGSRARALQAAGVGMSLAVAAMIFAATGALNATSAAVSQEFIDMAAILWALVPVATKLKN